MGQNVIAPITFISANHAAGVQAVNSNVLMCNSRYSVLTH